DDRLFKGADVMRFRNVTVLLALLFATAAMASAQETTGTIRGRIVDASGLAAPGVAVTATGTQGNKTAVTDADGRFNIPFLTPGTYGVQAQLQGFKTFQENNVTLALGQTADLLIRMEVGGVAQTVTVTVSTR